MRAVPDPQLDDLWQRVLAAWSDDAAHAAFLEHARATQQLGAAAARYREQVKGGSAYRDDATRAAAAEKRLAAIAMLAMMELDQRREAREPGLAPARLVSWAAALLLLGFSLFVLGRFVLR